MDSATTTTATIVGNAITVNMANNGTSVTADTVDVINAIEAVDTANLVMTVYPTARLDPTAPFGNNPTPMAATNLTGGGNGSDTSITAEGLIGTINVNQLRITTQYVGSGWNDTTVTFTHNGWDGRATADAVYNFSTNTLTINLANNGVDTITTVIDDLTNVVSSLSSTFLDEQGRMMYNYMFGLTATPGTDGATATVPVYSGQPLSGGTDGDFDVMKLWGTDPRLSWIPDEGDTVYVERGQEWGSLWIFNDEGEWVKQGAADGQEASFISAYVGKPSQGNVSPVYTSQKVITNGDNLTAAVGKLDARIGDNLKESKSSAVTTSTPIDSIVIEQNLVVSWMVHVAEVANPTNIYTAQVLATHNGLVGQAATNVDYNEFSVLELGNVIDGLQLNVDYETSGALNARLLRLLVSSTDSVDVTVQKQVLRRVA